MFIKELTATEFAKDPRLTADSVLLVKDAISHWPAVGRWTPSFFARQCADIRVTVKYFTSAGITSQFLSMKYFVELLQAFNENPENRDIAPYCHDVPIFLQNPDLIADIEAFPSHLLPEFYRANWWEYVQFFISPSGATTPLHFDTLRTHNLFFQVMGDKDFYLIPWQDRNKCKRRGWRWFDCDPSASEDLCQLESSGVTVRKVKVSAGDMFYMPAGTLHHVKSNADCISFNLDFHNKTSVLKSFMGIKEGMPRTNLFYNWLTFRALFLGMDRSEFFKKYRSYLNFIS
ncbi:JmjC domain-containing protein [Rheinheimera sp. A13L]|uniref:cupin-like domain-containing protein n=1 Tax=Rheinheimera sp. A13L TaxID=506534 RepID=UPI00021248F0|nr:cupin-like domain-containing protein [Rheinheimera sp. A13L]EGM76584.1 JmjC domain-containing protein [Rheinheimera sp. A13L]